MTDRPLVTRQDVERALHGDGRPAKFEVHYHDREKPVTYDQIGQINFDSVKKSCWFSQTGQVKSFTLTVDTTLWTARWCDGESSRTWETRPCDAMQNYLHQLQRIAVGRGWRLLHSQWV